MNHTELAALLAEPTTPLMRAALRELPPKALETLASAAEQATEQGWRQVIADRARAFADAQPDAGPQPVTAYFTTTEDSGSGASVSWSPFIAALSPTEDMPDLRHTKTTARMVPFGETAQAEEDFADPQLAEALQRLAVLDPPSHADVLCVHLPTSRVTRVRT